MRSGRNSTLTIDEEGDPKVELDWDSLFHSEGNARANEITIGTSLDSDTLRLATATPEEIEADNVETYFGQPPPPHTIKVSFGAIQNVRSWGTRQAANWV